MNITMIDQAFEALKKFDWGSDHSAMKPIDEAVVATHGDKAARADLEKKLVAALDGTLTRAGKDFVCRVLMAIGTAASVPALSKLLAQPDDAHLARYALERIPGAEARQALLDSLTKSKGPQLQGVISSLGSRLESESVSALAGLLANSDEKVSIAAAAALGAIRNSEAAKALGGAKPSSDSAKMAVIDARLACAEGLLAHGKAAEALPIYKSLTGDDVPKHVKLGATRGILACAGKK
jgi:HEAT repeat protein